MDKQVNAERQAESVSGMGTAHFLWQRKKALLKEGYGIDWRTPAEMNPWRIFD